MTAKPKVTLMTIGYQGLVPAEFCLLLQKSGVRRVADVRQLPLSRKKGFSKTELAATLSANGIEYIGFPNLGTPPDIRNRYKKSGDFAQLKRAYLAYLGSQEPAVEELRELAAQGGCALLCFERDPVQCHRSILAEVVAGRTGSAFRIEHLGLRVEDAAQADLFGPERGAPRRA